MRRIEVAELDLPVVERASLPAVEGPARARIAPRAGPAIVQRHGSCDGLRRCPLLMLKPGPAAPGQGWMRRLRPAI